MSQALVQQKSTGSGLLLSSLAIALLMALCIGCKPSVSDKAPADKPSDKQSPDKEAKTTPAATDKTANNLDTGRGVLEAMAKAYSAAKTYSDNGTFWMKAESGDQKIDQKVNFSVAFERSGKLRLEAYLAKVVVDGKEFLASIDDLPGQVLKKDAPAELTMKSVYCDPILTSALSGGFAGGAPQLLMLIGEKPIESILRDSEEPKLVEPGEIEGRECYRVQLRRVDGLAVFWVDKETLVLRRLILPTDEIRRELAGASNTPIETLALVADFTGAQLNSNIDQKAFKYEVPENAQIVQYFIQPNPAQLLSKKVPDFKFVDLDGRPITHQTIAGKIAVLDFWATWCEPCRANFPKLQAVYEKYKDNPKVVFLAISVDDQKVDNKAIGKLLNDLAVTIPSGRDSDNVASGAFKFYGIPSSFIIDANGIVQDYEGGANPNLATTLPEKIEKLMAGENIYEEPLKRYEEELKKENEQFQAAQSQNGNGSKVEERAIPKAEIAKPTQPIAFRLTKLWKCTDLKSLGNILVLNSPNAKPRLFVIDCFKSVAEIGLDGKVIGSPHKLPIGNEEVVSNLRSYIAPDGKIYFAAFASNQQRCHVFDEKWNLIVSFPADALENPHSGISDVQLGDLEGNGVPKLYVGYWGVVGVQAVSLEGKRLWSNRSIANVIRMAITGPDDQGKRELLCTNNGGTIVDLDAKGQRQAEISVTNRMFYWIVGDNLLGNGQMQWCALSAQKIGENVALGINLKGKELWNYPMPVGVQPQPIEQIIAGNIKANGPGQWILPGPDGSINILAADGKHLDSFNYGAALQGLTTVSIDGQPVLIVATANGLEAWKIE